MNSERRALNQYDELLKERPAGRIYHYTSQKGLIGILTRKSLWATSILHLNDAAEFAYAISLVKSAVKRRLDFSKNANELAILRAIRVLISTLNRNDRFIVCAACFSENSDQLRQWRGYCSPGSGFSIGFEYAQLEPPMMKSEVFLARCVYDIHRQIQLIDELLDGILATAGTSHSEGPDLEKELITFLRKIVYVGSLLKHPSFHEEREWRIVAAIAGNFEAELNVREGQSILIPYYTLQLVEKDQPLKLTEIVVGPNPEMDLAVRSVKLLLAALRVEAAVRPSEVPYREW